MPTSTRTRSALTWCTSSAPSSPWPPRWACTWPSTRTTLPCRCSACRAWSPPRATCSTSSAPSTTCTTASPSASARTPRRRATTWRRWPRSSRGGRTSSTCATCAGSTRADPSSRPTTWTARWTCSACCAASSTSAAAARPRGGRTARCPSGRTTATRCSTTSRGSEPTRATRRSAGCVAWRSCEGWRKGLCARRRRAPRRAARRRARRRGAEPSEARGGGGGGGRGWRTRRAHLAACLQSERRLGYLAIDMTSAAAAEDRTLSRGASVRIVLAR
mmetsp:Transcript_48955/g.121487  ORF Transcript_48955/g.121487 Transcript_48955/m.121487 type:complete len:275 (+) Transcript_48955:643-1467(+)